jgi:predicted RNA binding protein YcfA (HicA-like mRNA interferase family)
MGKSVSSGEAIKELENRGWVAVRQSGSHITFKYVTASPMLITVPHPYKALSPGVIRQIERIAGFRF